jgi:transcription-repair coupling factor (superfamily II helicase)
LRAARGELVDGWTPELHLGLAGRLPEEWIPEEEIRANLYARIARLASPGELDALSDELEDRFGALPPEAQDLIALAQVRQLARAAGIARIDAGPGAIALTPRAGFAAQAEELEQKGDRLLLKERIDDPRERLARLRTLLEELVPD